MPDVLAKSTRRVRLKDAHVVIPLLPDASKFVIAKHRRKLSSHIPELSVADMVASVRENGSHDVIVGLSSAFKVLSDVHARNPASDNPHGLLYRYSADNVRNVCAKGVHVVILGLPDACSIVSDVHERNPSSHKPQVDHCADKDMSEFANGSHVVIPLFRSAFRIFIVLHKYNPLSSIAEYPDAESMRRVHANGAHDDISLLLSAYKFVNDVHKVSPSSVIADFSRACNLRRECAKGSQVVMNA